MEIGQLRENGLLGTYRKLKEAGTPSDFPEILANVQYKLLIQAFGSFPSEFAMYTKKGNLADFKQHTRKYLGGMKDLKSKQPGGGYLGADLKDYGYNITLETFGRLLTLTRETIINDDLDAFQQLPKDMGKAAKRTLGKSVCNYLETCGLAYDGSSLARTANIGYATLTADTTGIAALQAGMLAIRKAADPHSGEILGLTAKYLVVPPDLAEIAAWLLSADRLVGSTSSLATNPLLNPALGPKPTLIVEPLLTNFTARWYLLADPNDLPALEVGYLDGRETPELFLKRSDAVRVGGAGADDFGFDYDDQVYKVRHDWGVAGGFHQAIYFGGH